MYTAYPYQIDIQPGVVRIHTDHKMDEWQMIELSAEQIPEFCNRLQEFAKEAAALQVELDEHEEKCRLAKVEAKKNEGK